MSRRPARCTEAELKRAIKAMLATGHGAVEILPDGTIRLIPNMLKPPEDDAPKRRIAL